VSGRPSGCATGQIQARRIERNLSEIDHQTIETRSVHFGEQPLEHWSLDHASV
jgi:hypothetical protein